MPHYRVLLLNPGQLTAYAVGPEGVRGEAAFAADAEGWEAFAVYLAAHRRSVFMLLADVAEEGFQLEEIPYATGKDRLAIIGRRIDQYFHGTYALANREGRRKSGRRDERLLLMALTRPQTFEPWLTRLDIAEARLAGFFSLPQLLAHLLPDERGGQQLLIVPTAAGLRQSFFDHGQLRFSRLTPLSADAPQGGAQAIATEAGKLHQYLFSQRLIVRGQPLATRLVLPAAALGKVTEVCCDNDRMHFTFADLSGESTRLGLRTAADCDTVDALCCHLLLRRMPPVQFALPAQRRFYQRWRIGFLLQGLGALLFAGGLAVAAKLAFDAGDLQAQTALIVQQTTLDQHRYATAMQALPKIPLTVDQLRELVQRFDELDRRAAGPAPLLVYLSHSLDLFTDIALDSLEWKIVDRLGNGNEAGNLPMLPAGEVATLGNGPFAQLKVTARLPALVGQARTAQVDFLKAFFAHLTRTPGYRVQVVRMPIDLQSTKTLKSDDAGGVREAPQFAFLLIRSLNTP